MNPYAKTANPPPGAQPGGGRGNETVSKCECIMEHMPDEVNSIRGQVQAVVDLERSTFQPANSTTTDERISNCDLWRAVNSGEDGDAWL